MRKSLTNSSPATKALVGACLFGLLAASTASAQVCGDVNDDDKVTSSDSLMVLRAAVGQDVNLICNDQCAALEERVAMLEALLANVTIVGDNLRLTGMNLQVVSGSGSTSGSVNGTGNVIVGYNESNSNNDERTGSHTLVVGRYHSYSSYGGIVAGEDNIVSGEVAAVLGGAQNEADGDGAVVVGGYKNRASGETSAVLSGETNRAGGRSCAVTSGVNNLCTGLAATVTGGTNNFCSGNGSVIGGGGSRSLGSNTGWLAGSLGPVF